MIRTARIVLALATCAAAQAPYAVGVRDVAWPDTTGSGSPLLTARVHYPAAAPGSNVPILPRASGWPVVVFLHGFAALGSLYGTLGDALAAEGYVAVMSDTAQFDSLAQERDGIALFAALGVASRTPGGPFTGALDLSRAGLAGHSMGGGNVANVLARNPGYRCGFALAPITARGANGALVAVPFGIVVGTGDAMTPWQTWALPLYQSLTSYTGLKHLYLLNADCTHTTVAGLFLSGGAGAAIFDRVRATMLGFFDRFLRDEPSGLEQVVGLSARAEPRLVSESVEVELPEVWPATPIHVGATTRISIAAEPGACGALAAVAFGSTPTPFGELRLDGQTTFVAFAGAATGERRCDASLTLRADPALLGARLPVQAFGPARGAALVLGSATTLVVSP